MAHNKQITTCDVTGPGCSRTWIEAGGEPWGKTCPIEGSLPAQTPSLSIFSRKRRASDERPCALVGVPGYGADGEVGWRLRLVHEERQVHAALVSRHGHHGVSLSLVALVKQLWDEPNIRVRFTSLRKYVKPLRTAPRPVSPASPTTSTHGHIPSGGTGQARWSRGSRRRTVPHTPALKWPGAGLSSHVHTVTEGSLQRIKSSELKSLPSAPLITSISISRCRKPLCAGGSRAGVSSLRDFLCGTAHTPRGKVPAEAPLGRALRGREGAQALCTSTHTPTGRPVTPRNNQLFENSGVQTPLSLVKVSFLQEDLVINTIFS